MTPETEAALDASIKHWEENLEHVKAGEFSSVSYSAEDCALCRLFHAVVNTSLTVSCVGCPVYESTGNKHCSGTPYDEVRYAGNRRYVDNLITACLEEIEFLKSLKPNKDEPNA